jgi:anaerobic selenocysteine-containing dehydrogenase
VADDQTDTDMHVSRRRFLRLGVVAGGGTVLGIAGAGSAAAATAKVAKQTVSYQGTPKGPARCGTCSFFQAPSSCNYVDGPINPSGWCVLYRAKS